MIHEPAPAKINLALHVRRRRPDGYHDIETVFAFCEDGDRLELVPDGRGSLEVGGPFAAGLDGGPGNTVLAAAAALRAACRIDERFSFRLEKNLPVASGIGGGSADAGAALRLICRWAGIDPDDARVTRAAAQVGADVPACLASRTTFGEGRGDVIRPAGDALAGKAVLLVNPGVPVSTAEVFAGWGGVDGGALDPEDPFAGRNDLAIPARRICPKIEEAIGFLEGRPGAAFARMSGSGASCFALFDEIAARDAAAAAAPAGWWTLATRLRR